MLEVSKLKAKIREKSKGNKLKYSFLKLFYLIRYKKLLIRDFRITSTIDDINDISNTIQCIGSLEYDTQEGKCIATAESLFDFDSNILNLEYSNEGIQLNVKISTHNDGSIIIECVEGDKPIGTHRFNGIVHVSRYVGTQTYQVKAGVEILNSYIVNCYNEISKKIYLED